MVAQVSVTGTKLVPAPRVWMKGATWALEAATSFWTSEKVGRLPMESNIFCWYFLLASSFTKSAARVRCVLLLKTPRLLPPAKAGRDGTRCLTRNGDYGELVLDRAGRDGLVVEVAADGHGRLAGDELLDAGVAAEFGAGLGGADIVLEEAGVGGHAFAGFRGVQAGDERVSVLGGDAAAVGPEVRHGRELGCAAYRDAEHPGVGRPDGAGDGFHVGQGLGDLQAELLEQVGAVVEGPDADEPGNAVVLAVDFGGGQDLAVQVPCPRPRL